MNDPKISVIMPVWNGERYLREAVESILNQTFREFEFVILDDGSTDSTPTILAEYGVLDNRVRIITLNHDGIVVALNRGVAESRAEWIARMDCDDISHPERFAEQWEKIMANPNSVLCHTNYRLVGDSKFFTKLARFPTSQAMLALRLCTNTPIIHPTVMFRKAAFHTSGGYLQEERHAEDFGLWGRIILFGECIGVRDCLLDFRVHEASISKKILDYQKSLGRQIALKHCANFMRLNDNDAIRTYDVLRHDGGTTLREWFWFLAQCLPRMRWQSIEMWLWAFSQTCKRILRSLSGLI